MLFQTALGFIERIDIKMTVIVFASFLLFWSEITGFGQEMQLYLLRFLPEAASSECVAGRRTEGTTWTRRSVCGQGSWCNWCNGCLSFLLCCHSLMTWPSSGGSLWQNTGTRSAGRRLSDSAALADAVLPPVSLPPPSSLLPLFVW